jgi:hypothetical protein
MLRDDDPLKGKVRASKLSIAEKVKNAKVALKQQNEKVKKEKLKQKITTAKAGK